MLDIQKHSKTKTFSKCMQNNLSEPGNLLISVSFPFNIKQLFAKLLPFDSQQTVRIKELRSRHSRRYLGTYKTS